MPTVNVLFCGSLTYQHSAFSSDVNAKFLYTVCHYVECLYADGGGCTRTLDPRMMAQVLTTVLQRLDIFWFEKFYW
jgi:hypothetical protein